MKIVRSSLVSALALVVGLALLAPVPARAQRNGNLQITQFYYGATVPATESQLVRVTVGHPSSAAPTDTSDDLVIVVAGPGNFGHVKQTLDPGTSFTYTLDPRRDGQLVDPKWGLFHVPVRFQIEAEVVEGQPIPRPSITIEVVHARTGEVQSFLAFPGFAGGVSVATGDVN